MNDVRPDDVTDEEWDSARRMVDAVNIHVSVMRLQFRDRPGYVGISLDSGSSPDGTLYDSVADCLRHNPHDRFLFPCRVGKMEMSVTEAATILKLMRRAKAAGAVFHHELPVVPMLPELIKPGRIDFSRWGVLKGNPE